MCELSPNQVHTTGLPGRDSNIQQAAYGCTAQFWEEKESDLLSVRL